MKNPWVRQGFFYVATVQLAMPKRRTMTVTRTLDFLSYHLIRLIHGESKLIEMAYDIG